MEWQNLGGDNWVLGEKIRGIVRKSVAEVYYGEDAANCRGAWLWFLVEFDERGTASSLRQAIEDAEKGLAMKMKTKLETDLTSSEQKRKVMGAK